MFLRCVCFSSKFRIVSLPDIGTLPLHICKLLLHSRIQCSVYVIKYLQTRKLLQFYLLYFNFILLFTVSTLTENIRTCKNNANLNNVGFYFYSLDILFYLLCSGKTIIKKVFFFVVFEVVLLVAFSVFIIVIIVAVVIPRYTFIAGDTHSHIRYKLIQKCRKYTIIFCLLLYRCFHHTLNYNHRIK